MKDANRTQGETRKLEQARPRDTAWIGLSIEAATLELAQDSNRRDILER